MSRYRVARPLSGVYRRVPPSESTKSHVIGERIVEYRHVPPRPSVVRCLVGARMHVPRRGRTCLREHDEVQHLVGAFGLAQQLLCLGFDHKVQLVVVVGGDADPKNSLPGLNHLLTAGSCSKITIIRDHFLQAWLDG